MHEQLKANIRSIPDGIETPWGETAWPETAIPAILEAALNNNWIILGGDVLTSKLVHTYDNWYFNPVAWDTLKNNVIASIEKCSQYISEYTKRIGSDFYYVLVISDAYSGGIISIPTTRN